MHEVLAKVVGLEAGKLLKQAEGPLPLTAEQLSALEILARCAKALKSDGAASDRPTPTTEEALALVGNG